jgi:hypothetical protein
LQGEKLTFEELVNLESNAVKITEFQLVDGLLNLKKKNKLFMEVQLQMLFSNCSSCDVWIYTRIDKHAEKVEVIFDSEYSKNALRTIGQVFFNNLLFQLVELSNSQTLSEENREHDQSDENLSYLFCEKVSETQTTLSCSTPQKKQATEHSEDKNYSLLNNDELAQHIIKFENNILSWLDGFRY